MIKWVTMLKRRAGMSREAFIDYYEDHHRLLGERVLSGHACHYARRFIAPQDGAEREGDFDVVMEIWFAQEQARDACLAALASPAVRAAIDADEERLFDRPATRRYAIIAESVSDLPAPG